MTLVDSLDSVLMLYAYVAPTQDPDIKRFALTFDDSKRVERIADYHDSPVNDPNVPILAENDEIIIENERLEDPSKPMVDQAQSDVVVGEIESGPSQPKIQEQVIMDTKANTISSLSIVLTLLSILVALAQVSFDYSLSTAIY